MAPLPFSLLSRALMAGGSAPAPAPATIFSSYNDAPSALMGFCTQPSAGRWNMTNAAVEGASLAYRIKGSSASMYAFGGDVTP